MMTPQTPILRGATFSILECPTEGQNRFGSQRGFPHMVLKAKIMKGW